MFLNLICRLTCASSSRSKLTLSTSIVFTIAVPILLETEIESDLLDLFVFFAGVLTVKIYSNLSVAELSSATIKVNYI